MNMADELEKLHNLKESGALSEEEFEKAKATLLAGERPVSEKVMGTVSEISSDATMWGMFIHLSQFCGYLAPLAGLVVPIVLWQIKKDDSPTIDEHGKVVVNWIVSALIYAIISGILCVVGIGIPMLIVLAILAVVFPIVGALKAAGGEVWRYPCSIGFFKLDEWRLDD